MKTTNIWTLKDIGCTELINVFAGQSFWHSHISSAFGDIQNHKAMVEWLEQEEDDEEPSDLEVWHLQKSCYTFKDLGLWKKEGTLDKEYQKRLAKGKTKARQTEQRDKNREAVYDDSVDKGETSKKGRKSSGKSNKSVSKSSGSRSQK